MNAGISIRPSRDLRSNYSQISSLARQNPVAITVNGKEDTVVMSHESFVSQQNYIAEMEAKLAVYAHLAQAADDVKLGRVQNLDAACDDILSELDALELSAIASGSPKPQSRIFGRSPFTSPIRPRIKRSPGTL